MNVLWHILNVIISSISNILEEQIGLSQNTAYQVSVELVIALFATFVFLFASYAPVSRKILLFLIAVVWIMIFLALVT